MSDKDNVVQQAQIWAQEARTQREIVLSILRYFGLPERDWEALRLIQAHLESRATALLTELREKCAEMAEDTIVAEYEGVDCYGGKAAERIRTIELDVAVRQFVAPAHKPNPEPEV